jgi:hypothetical protein
MKRLFIYVNLVVAMLAWPLSGLFADGSINPYYRGEVEGTLEQLAGDLKSSLTESGFEILGDYNPAGENELYLIAFTSDELLEITLKDRDEKALASALKIGLMDLKNGKVQVSLLNPTYLFYSYLRHDYEKYEEKLNELQMQTMLAVASAGIRLLPSSEVSLRVSELKEFRFMVRMPGFDEQIKVNEFHSFDEGVRTINRNLMAHRGGTRKVYEVISEDKKIAVFGIGLLDNRFGEPEFLPALGEDHLAAMPYELILIENRATMLNGRFRFPLFWPELSMRELHKIGRIYRDIQSIMEGLTR